MEKLVDAYMCSKNVFVLLSTGTIQCFHRSDLSKGQNVHSTGVNNLIQRNVERNNTRSTRTRELGPTAVRPTSAKVCQKATKL